MVKKHLCMWHNDNVEEKYEIDLLPRENKWSMSTQCLCRFPLLTQGVVLAHDDCIDSHHCLGISCHLCHLCRALVLGCGSDFQGLMNTTLSDNEFMSGFTFTFTMTLALSCMMYRNEIAINGFYNIQGKQMEIYIVWTFEAFFIKRSFFSLKSWLMYFM